MTTLIHINVNVVERPFKRSSDISELIQRSSDPVSLWGLGVFVVFPGFLLPVVPLLSFDPHGVVTGNAVPGFGTFKKATLQNRG